MKKMMRYGTAKELVLITRSLAVVQYRAHALASLLRKHGAKELTELMRRRAAWNLHRRYGGRLQLTLEQRAQARLQALKLAKEREEEHNAYVLNAIARAHAKSERVMARKPRLIKQSAASLVREILGR
jgi:hypothetical protein